MNQSIHTIDLLQWYMGPVQQVAAFAGCLAHKRIEVEDAAVAAVRFRNGAVGTIIGTTAAYPGIPRKVQISGENGSIFLEDSFITKWEFSNTKAYDKKVLKQFGKDTGGRKAAGAADPSAIEFTPHQYQFENFVSALNGRGPLLVDGYEARKAVEIILAVYQSAQTGKIVNLPLKRTPVRRKFTK
jgi:predicted dehydrogenase